MTQPSRLALIACTLAVAGCNPAPAPAPPPAPAPAPAPAPSNPALVVVAAGNASSPPSLTAVTQDNRVTIDTVQPLHPAGHPAFQGLRLSGPAEQAPDALLGWQRASGEVVLVPAIERRKVRVVNTPTSTVEDGDQVLVFGSASSIDLPDVQQAGVPDGRVLTLKVVRGVGPVRVRNLDSGSLTLISGQALQVVAVKQISAWTPLSKN